MHRAATHPQRTGLAIAAVVAIPFLSVSGAALASDVASSPGGGRVPGLAAVGLGILSGLLVVRLVRALGRGLVQLSTAVVRWVAARSRVAPAFHRTGLVPRPLAGPAVVVVASAVRRRGPPVVLR